MIRPDQDLKNADWLKRKGQVEEPAPTRLPIQIPIRFIATIGGFGGSHYEVRWQRGKLRYRTDESRISIVPKEKDWEAFWAAIDRIGVWDWRAAYDDRETCDGTQWEVDLSNGSRRVRCFGSNAYPGGNDLVQAQAFQEFLKAVCVLVRQPFGNND